MAVDSTTKVIVRMTITARTTTRRAPRTGRVQQLRTKEAGNGEGRKPHEQPRSRLIGDGLAARIFADEHADQSLGERAEAHQRQAGNRHPAQPAYRLSFRPDDRPEDAHPGEQDVAEADHEPDGRGEDGEKRQVRSEKVNYLSPWTGRSYCTSTRDRSNGIGFSVRTCGALPAPQAVVSSGSCGQVSDSTVLPGTTTVTGRLAGIRGSSEPSAARARPGLAWALATLTPAQAVTQLHLLGGCAPAQGHLAGDGTVRNDQRLPTRSELHIARQSAAAA